MHSGSVSYHCKQCSVWPALLPASACAWNIIHQDMSLYSVMPLWLTCLAWESHQHAWHWQEQLVTPSQFLAITGIAQLRLKCKHLLPCPNFRFLSLSEKNKNLILEQKCVKPKQNEANQAGYHFNLYLHWQHKQVSRAGLEPAASGFQGQCNVLWATGC